MERPPRPVNKKTCQSRNTCRERERQLVNGQAMEVNTYFAKDKGLVKKALEQYTRESSAPDGPGIEKFFSKA